MPPNPSKWKRGNDVKVENLFIGEELFEAGQNLESDRASELDAIMEYLNLPPDKVMLISKNSKEGMQNFRTTKI